MKGVKKERIDKIRRSTTTWDLGEKSYMGGDRKQGKRERLRGMV